MNFDMDNSKNFIKTQCAKFVTFFDFEASTVIVDGQKVQIPNSYCIFSPDLMFLSDTNLNRDAYFKKYESDDPDDLLEHFINDLDKLHFTHLIRLQAHPDIPKLIPEEELRYKKAVVCEKCTKGFDKDRRKVRHHDHVTGKFVGAWCFKCNLLEGSRHFKTKLYSHNFRSYDNHFIIKYGIKYLHSKFPNAYNRQKVISKSSEKFKHQIYGSFEFSDTMNHLEESLDRLVSIIIPPNKKHPESESCHCMSDLSLANKRDLVCTNKLVELCTNKRYVIEPV
jgi:hypothetical protein